MKPPKSNISFSRSEIKVFRRIEKELMSRTNKTKSSCYKQALKDYHARIIGSRPSQWQSAIWLRKDVEADDPDQ